MNIKNEMKEGLRVLVTGGASGIGLKIADAFHSHGAKVFICGTNEEKLSKCLATHPNWGGMVCDVTDEFAVERFVEVSVESMGGLDVIVNNAGIAGPTTKLEDCSVDEWRKTVDINLNGVFLVSKFSIPHLRKSKGSIIHISSVAGRIGFALRSPYCSSKFALQGLTESMSKELGPDGIRVNSLLPGFVESERWTNTTKARAEGMGISYEEMRAQLLEKSSLKSTVSEEEIASMCLYLNSEMGQNITGQAISICANVEYL